MRTLARRSMQDLQRWPTPLLSVCTLLLVVLVASVDLSTGEELSFFVFYFIPVCFAAWTLHLRAAIIAAFLSTIGWLSVEALSGHKYSHPSLLFANLLIRWSSYTVIGYLFSVLRRSRADLYEYAVNLEDRVAERTASLQQRVAELELFSYSTSHNLRAPLRAMEGLTHMVEDCLQERRVDLIPPHLAAIRSSAVRMDRLLLDLVEYVQLTIREAELHPTDLNTLIRDVLASQRTAIEQKRASITIAPDMPVVWANKRLLATVVSQVLSNALKFVSPDSTPVISIKTASVPDEMIRLTIRDQGIGIGAEHQERIFGLFEQLHTYDRYGGTGMGLALARRAVEKMGGRMGCQSEPGKGAAFWIELHQHALQSTLKRS